MKPNSQWGCVIILAQRWFTEFGLFGTKLVTADEFILSDAPSWYDNHMQG